MSAGHVVTHALAPGVANTNTMGNRFLLAVVAFQRSKQLTDGAAARVPRDGHKANYIAVLEVLDNAVSWSRV